MVSHGFSSFKGLQCLRIKDAPRNGRRMYRRLQEIGVNDGFGFNLSFNVLRLCSKMVSIGRVWYSAQRFVNVG